jgi:hypothetical protein
MRGSSGTCIGGDRYAEAVAQRVEVAPVVME